MVRARTWSIAAVVGAGSAGTALGAGYKLLLVQSKTARAVIEADDAKARAVLAASGARVVPWRPEREDVRAALVKRGFA